MHEKRVGVHSRGLQSRVPGWWVTLRGLCRGTHRIVVTLMAPYRHLVCCLARDFLYFPIQRVHLIHHHTLSMADTDNTTNEASTAPPEETTTSDIVLQARRVFAEYDQNAILHQRIFHRRQFLILILGVFAVLLALSQTEFIGTEPPLTQEMVESLNASIQEGEASLAGLSGAARESALAEINEQKSQLRLHNIYNWLRYGIIIVPILISILIAVSNKLKAGSKWILLRSAAESVKREIYLYRASAGLYHPSALKNDITKDMRLADQMKTISDRLMKTVANEAGIERYTPSKKADDAIHVKPDAIATASEYIKIRLEDQLSFFADRTDNMALRLKYLQWFIYIAGGVGTFLAAIGLEIWVALTTALGTAFVTYLEYRQTENTLLLYNQVASELRNLKNWWLALSPSERESDTNKNLLIQQGEDILMNEQVGWVKNMTDAMAQLQAKQEQEKEDRLDHNAIIQQIKQLKEDAKAKKQATAKLMEEMKSLLEEEDG